MLPIIGMSDVDKKTLSERDICSKFITPALVKAGWDVQTQIWYYEHPYPPGVKSYNKTKPIHISEFDAEKKWWGRAGQASKRKESELAWRVLIEQIKASGYNLDIKNPNVVDPGHADPDKLLAEYQQLVKAVNDTREKLKRESHSALER